MRKSNLDALLGADKQPDDPRDGLITERQQTGRAFHLQIYFLDGRFGPAFPWALYNGLEPTFEERWEKVTILFANRVLEVRGQHLTQLIEAVAEESLRGIQQHNDTEIAMLGAMNNKVAREEKKAIIKSVMFVPPLADLVKAIVTTEEQHYEDGYGQP